MLSPRLATFAAVLTLVAVTTILWVYPSATAFALSNIHWNGLRRAVTEFRLIPLLSLADLPVAASGTALIIIPYLPPSSSDIQALKRYVEDGGVLILMNDFGFGNVILTHLGIGARFSDQLLVDPLFSYRSRRLPRIVDLLGGPLAERVETLILNHATVISGAAGVRVVAQSSLSSFLDTNRSGQRDPEEKQGPFPVVALARAGAGRVVLISDPSIAVNGMLGLGDNRRFLANVLGLAGEGGKVYIDQSLLPRAPFEVAKLGLAHLRRALSYPSVGFAAVAAGLAVPLVLLLLRPPRR